MTGLNSNLITSCLRIHCESYCLGGVLNPILSLTFRENYAVVEHFAQTQCRKIYKSLHTVVIQTARRTIYPHLLWRNESNRYHPTSTPMR